MKEFNIGDRVVVIKDIFADKHDPIGCVGLEGTIKSFDSRIEVKLDGYPVMGFDSDELELI